MSAMEWQCAEGSRTLHVIDTAKPRPKRTGPKALCGRRPQPTGRGWWWSLPVAEWEYGLDLRMGLTCCADCADALADLPAPVVPSDGSGQR